MKDYKKISKLSLWILLAIGVAVTILFFAGGSNGSLEVAGDFLSIPAFTTEFLLWNYILVALVCLVTFAVVVWKFIETYKVDQKKAMKKLIVVIGFILLLVVCWFAGSTDKVDIIGYEGTDNEGAMARLSDACLYVTYILVVATIATMAWGIIRTKRN